MKKQKGDYNIEIEIAEILASLEKHGDTNAKVFECPDPETQADINMSKATGYGYSGTFRPPFQPVPLVRSLQMKRIEEIEMDGNI